MLSRYRLIISVIFLAFLAFLLSRLDLSETYHQISRSNKAFLLVGILMFILSALVKIAKFSLISRYYSYSLSFMQSALIEMVGISIATLTPGRLGEGSKVILLNRTLKIPMSSSVSITIFERLLDVSVLSAGAFLLSFYILQDLAFLTGAVFLLLLMSLVLFLRFPTFQRLIPEKYRKYLVVEIRNDKVLFSVICVATVFTWMLDAALLWFILLSFDTFLPFYVVFGIFCISTITIFLSVLPAGIGTVDLSYLIMFPLVGVPLEVAAATVIIYRLFSISFPFLSSALVLNYHDLSISDIKQEVRQ